MARELEPFGDLDKLVYDHAEKKITEAKIKLDSMPDTCDGQKFRQAVEEVNRWVDFIIGDDNDELYDKYKQRLFQTTNGRLVTFNGDEIDVDVRRKRRKK